MIQQLPKPVTESLGEQMFDGIKAVGTRSVTTIPAGQMGNEKPLEIVFEKWYSPDLQTVLMTRQSDPRFGENTYKLVNIVRKDPAKSLFEVPSDYTSSGLQERTFNWKVATAQPAVRVATKSTKHRRGLQRPLVFLCSLAGFSRID